MERLEIEFEIEKETKNTFKYAEITDGEPAKIGGLYVQKWALKRLNKEIPRKLKITVEAL